MGAAEVSAKLSSYSYDYQAVLFYYTWSSSKTYFSGLSPSGVHVVWEMTQFLHVASRNEPITLAWRVPAETILLHGNYNDELLSRKKRHTTLETIDPTIWVSMGFRVTSFLPGPRNGPLLRRVCLQLLKFKATLLGKYSNLKSGEVPSWTFRSNSMKFFVLSGLRDNCLWAI